MAVLRGLKPQKAASETGAWEANFGLKTPMSRVIVHALVCCSTWWVRRMPASTRREPAFVTHPTWCARSGAGPNCSDLGIGFRAKPPPQTIDDNLFVSDMAGIPSANIVDYRIKVRPMGYGPFHHTHADNMSIIDRNTLNEVGSTVLSVVYEP